MGNIYLRKSCINLLFYENSCSFSDILINFALFWKKTLITI